MRHLFLLAVADDDKYVAALLADPRTATLGAGREAAQRRPLLDEYARHAQLVDIGAVIMHGDRQTDEIRNNGRAARPGLDRALVLRGLRRLDFLQQVAVDEGAFFQRAGHDGFSANYLRWRRCTIIESVRLFLRVR